MPFPDFPECWTIADFALAEQNPRNGTQAVPYIHKFTPHRLSVRRRGQCRPPYHMIICIESHLGDIYLSGKTRTKSELKRQLLYTEAIRDVAHDNFVPLLCRLYGWELTAETAADFTWDRDTELLLPLTHQ